MIRPSGEELSLLTNEPPLSTAVFREGIARVGANFGIDYAAGEGGRPTANAAKALTLLEELRRKGYTDSDFRFALDRFLESCRFPTWTIADFLAASRPKVYPHAWYVRQITGPPEGDGSLDNAALIGCYRAPDVDHPVFGWKDQIGTRLPAWTREDVRKQLEATKEPLRDDIAATIAETKAMLATKASDEQTIRELKSRNAMLEIDLAEARRQLEAERDFVAFYADRLEAAELEIERLMNPQVITASTEGE